MKIILVHNLKGGKSSSTLAHNLASALENTAVFDLDPQGSLISFKHLLGVPLVDESELYKKNYDYIFVDSPPYNSTKLEEIMKLSDFVLVPVRPNYVDIMATKTIIQLLEKYKKPHAIVLTQVQHRINIDDSLDLLNSYGSPVLKTRMTQRVSYARSILYGSVFKLDDLKSQNEILSIATEIITKLGILKNAKNSCKDSLIMQSSLLSKR